MNYAVVKTGGKQYRVSLGDVITVERVKSEPNSSFTFEEVLLVASDGDVKVGSPLVSGIKVTGTIVGNLRGEKIRVAKFKAKSRYRRVTGHRQELTQIKIDAIGNQSSRPKDIQPMAENQSSRSQVKNNLSAKTPINAANKEKKVVKSKELEPKKTTKSRKTA